MHFLKTFMAKRVNLILIFSFVLLAGIAHAEQTVSVVILPFRIHAQQDMAYLQKEIPLAIKKQLEQEGANVLILDRQPELSGKPGSQPFEEILKLAARTGADYVIFGSLTWIGQSFSLDAKLVASQKQAAPDVFSAEGRGAENLPGTVKELVQEIELKLFKREKIVKVVIKGNNRIEKDAILRVISIKTGDTYNLQVISDQLKAVYAMGYFDDIRVQAQTVPEGKIVIFEVEEKPTVRGISVSGNSWVYEDDDIKDVLTLRKGSILNINTLQSDMRRIKELYKEKNFYNAKVHFKIQRRKDNQADVEYIIDEGNKLHIQKIEFVGNSAYSSKKLKRLMSTSEKDFLSWVTSSGDLNQEQLSQDVARLTAWYQNHGYSQARIGEPKIEYEKDGIVITIRIEEGPRYRVGKVSVTGDLIIPEQQLLGKLKIAEEEYYNRDILRKDVMALTDVYSDEGYANADIAPRIDRDTENIVVNIIMDIKKGHQVYFEEITITGNTKTRDKVIRRQLQVYEHELFSGRRLKRSIRNLYRLDYFEDIKVNTVKGSSDDKMRLKINVTEKNTGAFSFGAGFGNVENVFLTSSISERNLFGRGQTLSLQAQLGSKTTKYTLSFTEPWLFDIPLSANTEVYNWVYNFNDYDKDSIGGSFGLSYPLIDYTRGFLTYTYDIANITNIDEDAAESIKRDKGKNTKSSITARVRYDSRDQTFNPTTGSFSSLSAEFAGLGGNVGFTKYIAETGWYFPLLWETVGVLHGRAGWVIENPKKDLPDYEKFYMVGVNALRGFERGDLSPTSNGGSEIGGERFVQFNAEYRFPVVKTAGVYWAVFFDTGNIAKTGDRIELTNLRQSAGTGLRWLSPMGPIILEYAWILDRKKSDHGSGAWVFTMASSF